MPKHFTSEERIEIEGRLLAAAKASFLYFGMNKTTVEDITQNAGVAKGTFYLFFKSKGDIFMRLYSDEWKMIHDELDQKYLGKKGKLADLITGYISENRKALLSHPLLASVYERDTMVSISDRTVSKRLMEFKQMSDGSLTKIIKSWIEANELNCPIDPEVISGMIRSTSYLNYHKDEIGEEIFDEVISQLIHGITLVVEKR
jgi:AcrR family transcriptional regulator